MQRDVRFAFRLLFVCLVCVGIGQSMLFAILPPAAREIGLSPFQLSTVFATSATIWVVMSPRWGRRSDVIGRRPVILIGLLGFALSMVLLAASVEAGMAGVVGPALAYPMLVGSRAVFALLGSGTGPASQAYVADRTSVVERVRGVAFLNAAFGFGQTLGPAVGAALAGVGLMAPIYCSAALAVASAAGVWAFLPEGPAHARPDASRSTRLGVRDHRIRPFLLVGVALQAVTATTTITLALFLQDVLGLGARDAARAAGTGFVVVAVAGLFAQLVLVQRFRPSARDMMRAGAVFLLVAFVVLAVGERFEGYLVGLAAMGLGAGLLRPGGAAGASLSVDAEEQGGVAGLLGGLAVVGNIFGPLLGTAVYALRPSAPYVLNAAIMALVVAFVWTSSRIRSLRG